jgi:hypothetical protein
MVKGRASLRRRLTQAKNGWRELARLGAAAHAAVLELDHVDVSIRAWKKPADELRVYIHCSL